MGEWTMMFLAPSRRKWIRRKVSFVILIPLGMPMETLPLNHLSASTSLCQEAVLPGAVTFSSFAPAFQGPGPSLSICQRYRTVYSPSAAGAGAVAGAVAEAGPGVG